MEMNTRIQVEHSRDRTGDGRRLIDAAAGSGRRTDRRKKFKPKGHAIECRINAEDPEKDFRPSPGEINELSSARGIRVRVDTHCYQGYKIPPYYDSLIAKLIVTAPRGREAIGKLRCARRIHDRRNTHDDPFHRR